MGNGIFDAVRAGLCRLRNAKAHHQRQRQMVRAADCGKITIAVERRDVPAERGIDFGLDMPHFP